MTDRWKDFIRQIAAEFGHHPFLVKVVHHYSVCGVPSLDESLVAIQTAQSILKMRERRNLTVFDATLDGILGHNKNEDVESDTLYQSPQMAALLMKSGTISLKLNRKEEGKRDLDLALRANGGR